ncbi:glycosyltransferase family 2 protein [Bradyrhizobium sp. CB2312]|uniref:glycosyltransferase family 2 protein n=1 Tax=Bradyrhizobium sp. CB2312 TaxID=3039155 RepID=UPI0024B0BC4F|nr:glycosyltransferase family 2 protein [Bradyrhizobium sp. CB2312]WFU76465.1 glycosyltransferase family 2 protein [Bradyrhizobium sp. CB2312]
MSVSAAASMNEVPFNGSLQADRYGSRPGSELRPFISIALPTFRRPDTLRRAVESVLQQDFANWELVISDDEGLGGESSHVLSKYARREPRIRPIENRRGRGQVENTNNAMLACRGQWIKPLHDDDWLAPGALRTFVRLATAYPAVAFMTSTSHLVQDEGIRYRRGTQIFHYSGQECLADLYLAGKTRILGIVPSTLLVNSKVVKAGCLMRNYRSISWGVDQLFFIDLACHGDMVAIDDGLIFYDMTDHASITATGSFAQIDQETIDLKHLIWSLLQDKRGLPDPETMVRALRVARLRGRIGRQPISATIRDAFQILRPSVLRAANKARRAWARAPAATTFVLSCGNAMMI